MVESECISPSTKHIAVSNHFIRDLQEKKIMQLKYCPFEEMLADILTKLLPRQLFLKFAEQLGLNYMNSNIEVIFQIFKDIKSCQVQSVFASGI